MRLTAFDTLLLILASLLIGLLGAAAIIFWTIPE